MKSNKKLMEDYDICKRDLLTAMRNCISYYLSEEELKPFMEKARCVVTEEK